LIDPGTIGTKNGILVHQGAQYGADVGRINGLQPKVSRLSAAITHHQHRNVLPRSSHTASFACGPGQLALPLEGLQEEGLIGLDNPALVRGAVRGCGLEKTMAPEKRGVFIHCAASGGLTHAHTLHQCLRIAQPLLTFSQVRQGRAGERIAGLAAGVAAHARQSMAVAPRAQLLGWGLAVGAGSGPGMMRATALGAVSGSAVRMPCTCARCFGLKDPSWSRSLAKSLRFMSRLHFC
jgi:hypothetical protein